MSDNEQEKSPQMAEIRADSLLKTIHRIHDAAHVRVRYNPEDPEKMAEDAMREMRDML